MLNKKINKTDFDFQSHVEQYNATNKVLPEELAEYKVAQKAAAIVEKAKLAEEEAAQVMEVARKKHDQAQSMLSDAMMSLKDANSTWENAIQSAEAKLSEAAHAYAQKHADEIQVDYAETAAWCNANNAAIEDMGDYYEVVAIPVPTEAELHIAEINVELSELQAYLEKTDYIAVKIAEGAATREDYAEELAKRQDARERINELQAELSALETADDN